MRAIPPVTVTLSEETLRTAKAILAEEINNFSIDSGEELLSLEVANLQAIVHAYSELRQTLENLGNPGIEVDFNERHPDTDWVFGIPTYYVWRGDKAFLVDDDLRLPGIAMDFDRGGWWFKVDWDG